MGALLTALFTGVVALLAVLTYKARRRARAADQALVTRREALKELLGQQMERASVLAFSKDATDGEVHVWFERTCRLIDAALGSAERNIFMQHVPSDLAVRLAREGQTVTGQLWAHQESLANLIRRLDTLNVHETFDSVEWATKLQGPS